MSISSIQVYGTTSSGGGPEFTATSLKIADYTATSGDWVLCDTNAAAGDIDLILPATPTVGDAVKITLATAHATRIVTINRNSSTIDGGTTAEYQDYNKLWKVGDTVTFRCVAASAWVTSERQIANRFTASAKLAADQNNITNVIIQYSTELIDYNGNYDTGTYKYTIPISGIYYIKNGFIWINTTANVVLGTYFVSNIGTVATDSNSTSTANTIGLTTSSRVKFTVGDTIWIQGYVAGSTTIDISSTSNGFYIELIERVI